MTAPRSNPSEICPYRDICGPCGGPKAIYLVRLNSGELVEFRDVVDVRLTGAELVVTPADATPVSFSRADVYSAGCGLVAVPFLS